MSDKRCGTYAGYNRHVRVGTEVCAACRAAATSYHRRLRRRQKDGAEFTYLDLRQFVTGMREPSTPAPAQTLPRPVEEQSRPKAATVKPSTQDREWLTVDEMAQIVGVSAKTIRREISRGNLPAYRLGRLIRLRATDLALLAKPMPAASIGTT